jgi:hypothetical protein
MKKSRLLEIIQEEITLALKEVGQSPEATKATNLAIAAKKAQILAAQKELQQLQRSGVSEISLEEEEIDEMAKLTTKDGEGEPVTFGNNKPTNLTPLGKKTAEFIKANPNLSKSALLNALIADKEVSGLLDKKAGEEFAQNQTNKFAALVRGEREVGPRGRKADPTKAKVEPKAKAEPKSKAEPKAKAEKASTKDMDDEDKEATASIGKDETAKELGKTAPKDKIEKFNLGLKFIKKYKDEKPKVDAYLKKAKEEYKLPVSMLNDLKKAAGREVGI